MDLVLILQQNNINIKQNMLNEILNFYTILNRSVINNLQAELEKIQYFKLAKTYGDFEIIFAHNLLNYRSLTLPMEVNGANKVQVHRQLHICLEPTPRLRPTFHLLEICVKI